MSHTAIRMRVLPALPPTDPQQASFRVSGGYVQWKLTDDAGWTNLVALADITGPQGETGPNVELRTDGTNVQWRAVGDETWIDLVPLTDITGPTPTLVSGTTTTLAPGSEATATITDNGDGSFTLSFGVPRGASSADVATRSLLAALNPVENTIAYLTEAGREGLFKWTAGNLSALVAADTHQGIYVPPASDPTGASGAWVRVAAFAGPGGSAFIWLAAWWGVTPDPTGSGTGTDQSPAINSMVAVANVHKPNTLLFGGGLFPLDAAITKFAYIAEVSGQSAGAQPTIFYKRYVEASTTRGIFSSGDYAATYRDIQFAAAAAASGGSAISAILETADRPNIQILNLERVYSSCGNGIRQNLYVSGLANDPVAGGAAGASYRSIRMTQCHLFGAADYCLVLNGVQHVFGSDNFIAGSGGSINSGNVLYISGSANAYCDDITFTGGIIAGNVYCDFIGNVTVPIDGRVTFDTPIYGNLTVGGSSTGPVQIAYISGSVNASSGVVKRTVYKVEEGSNANGSWIKYDSGLVEQWGRVTTAANGDATVTFPKAFGAAPTGYGANCSDAPAANFINLAQAYGATASTMNVRLMTFSTANNVGLVGAGVKWWAKGY